MGFCPRGPAGGSLGRVGACAHAARAPTDLRPNIPLSIRARGRRVRASGSRRLPTYRVPCVARSGRGWACRGGSWGRASRRDPPSGPRVWRRRQRRCRRGSARRIDRRRHHRTRGPRGVRRGRPGDGAWGRDLGLGPAIGRDERRGKGGAAGPSRRRRRGTRHGDRERESSATQVLGARGIEGVVGVGGRPGVGGGVRGRVNARVRGVTRRRAISRPRGPRRRPRTSRALAIDSSLASRACVSKDRSPARTVARHDQPCPRTLGERERARRCCATTSTTTSALEIERPNRLRRGESPGTAPARMTPRRVARPRASPRARRARRGRSAPCRVVALAGACRRFETSSTSLWTTKTPSPTAPRRFPPARYSAARAGAVAPWRTRWSSPPSARRSRRSARRRTRRYPSCGTTSRWSVGRRSGSPRRAES